MTAPSPYRTRRGPAVGDPVVARLGSSGAVRCPVRFLDPLIGVAPHMLATKDPGGGPLSCAEWRVSRIHHCIPFLAARKLGLKQSSLHHTHLAHDPSARLRRPTWDVTPTCYVSVPLSGFQPLLAPVSRVGRSSVSKPRSLKHSLLIRATTAHALRVVIPDARTKARAKAFRPPPVVRIQGDLTSPTPTGSAC